MDKMKGKKVTLSEVLKELGDPATWETDDVLHEAAINKVDGGCIICKKFVKPAQQSKYAPHGPPIHKRCQPKPA